jgi:4-oxalocrotonate tautomerase
MRGGRSPRDTRREVDERRTTVPLIHVKLIEDVFTPEQKRQMIERLTDAMVSIEGENLRGVTWVLLEDLKSGDWGMGGNPVTTADVHALQSGAGAPA